MDTPTAVARIRGLASPGRPLLVVGPHVHIVTEALRAPDLLGAPHVVWLARFSEPEPLLRYVRSRPLGAVVLEGVDLACSCVVIDLSLFLRTTSRVVVATCSDASQVPRLILNSLFPATGVVGPPTPSVLRAGGDTG